MRFSPTLFHTQTVKRLKPRKSYQIELRLIDFIPLQYSFLNSSLLRSRLFRIQYIRENLLSRVASAKHMDFRNISLLTMVSNFDKPRLDVFEAVFGSANTTTAMQKTFAAIHAHFQYIVDSSNQRRVVKSDEIDLVTLT